MSSNAIPFRPVVVETTPGNMHDDREIAQRIGKASHQLQEAMDSAIKAGLIVKPSFKRAANRYGHLGIAADGFVCSVHVYRSLC